ncbi:hypothetical protein [Burkholderia sp. SIMBA_062]|uniref:hypothetical protein n=1 Tax=Burkholderia sp. SIMBA_062 TaxID=3085803 RepID=UPI00397E4FE0
MLALPALTDCDRDARLETAVVQNFALADFTVDCGELRCLRAPYRYCFLVTCSTHVIKRPIIVLRSMYSRFSEGDIPRLRGSRGRCRTAATTSARRTPQNAAICGLFIATSQFS